MKKKIVKENLRNKLAVKLQTLHDLDLRETAGGGCLASPPTCDASTSSCNNSFAA